LTKVGPLPTLHELVAAELAQPADPRVVQTAAAVAALYPNAAQAVLFYGSCLRSSSLDGAMLDFYLIVSSYRAAYGKSWLATANRLVPPNVFPFEHKGLAAKYAVLSEDDFAQECGSRARSVSVWARFAQPSRLVWARHEAAGGRAIASIAEAVPTLLALTLPLFDAGEADIRAIWTRGFSLTYGAELRAEQGDRSPSIVESEPDRYRRFGEAALAHVVSLPKAAAERTWRRLRRRGKLLSVVRLAKASATFAGGIDYLAWKISRHSGQTVVIHPWHRRFPLFAALILLPKLLARGAVR